MPRWFVIGMGGETPLFQQWVEHEIEGTEEEALAGLRDIVDNFAKAHTERGRRRQRREVSRISERSYFVRVHNWKVEQAQFTLTEVVADTQDDALPDTVSGGPGAVPVPGP